MTLETFQHRFTQALILLCLLGRQDYIDAGVVRN